jgi:hypothetical protein
LLGFIEVAVAFTDESQGISKLQLKRDIYGVWEIIWHHALAGTGFRPTPNSLVPVCDGRLVALSGSAPCTRSLLLYVCVCVYALLTEQLAQPPGPTELQIWRTDTQRRISTCASLRLICRVGRNLVAASPGISPIMPEYEQQGERGFDYTYLH